MPALRQLPPGTHFALAEMEEITGQLLSVSDTGARVKLDVRVDGEVRGTHQTRWSAQTQVIVLQLTGACRQLQLFGGRGRRRAVR